VPFVPFFVPYGYIASGLVFAVVAVVFILTGNEIKWRLRGVALLVMLVIASSFLGLAVTGLRAGLEVMPKEAGIDDLPDQVGFHVFVPEYLPAGIELERVAHLPYLNNSQIVLIDYAGPGDGFSAELLSIRLKKSSDNEPGMGEFPDEPREPIQLDSGTGYAFSVEGAHFVSVEIDGTSIDLSTTLPQEELLKVAQSLKRR
jgi:hypothetical protein